MKRGLLVTRLTLRLTTTTARCCRCVPYDRIFVFHYELGYNTTLLQQPKPKRPHRRTGRPKGWHAIKHGRQIKVRVLDSSFPLLTGVTSHLLCRCRSFNCSTSKCGTLARRISKSKTLLSAAMSSSAAARMMLTTSLLVMPVQLQRVPT